jgi:hypothetical protein
MTHQNVYTTSAESNPSPEGLGLGESLGSTISDTPRTDKLAGEWIACETVPASHARELERELSTEKETAKRWEATAWEHGIENNRLREAISAFCVGQAWVDQSWKDQPHIRPLFYLSNAASEGRSE